MRKRNYIWFSFWNRINLLLNNFDDKFIPLESGEAENRVWWIWKGHRPLIWSSYLMKMLLFEIVFILFSMKVMWGTLQRLMFPTWESFSMDNLIRLILTHRCWEEICLINDEVFCWFWRNFLRLASKKAGRKRNIRKLKGTTRIPVYPSEWRMRLGDAGKDFGMTISGKLVFSQYDA